MEIRRENLGTYKRGNAGGFGVPEVPVYDTRGFIVKLSLCHRSLVESGTSSKTRTARYTTPLYRVSQTSRYSQTPEITSRKS